MAYLYMMLFRVILSAHNRGRAWRLLLATSYKLLGSRITMAMTAYVYRTLQIGKVVDAQVNFKFVVEY
jgi:hypothetical protein